MNRQEVFDKVATHLLSQKATARDPIGRVCKYRGAGGLKCAVGCLIPDANYVPRMEDRMLDSLLREFPDVFEGTGIDTSDDRLMDMLADLQYVHDDASICDWREELEKVAMRYDLDMYSIRE